MNEFTANEPDSPVLAERQPKVKETPQVEPVYNIAADQS